MIKAYPKWLKVLKHHSADEIAKDIERDKILTADDAKEYGIVDAVISSRKA